MGVDAVDVDDDGDLDLFMTHLHKETNTFYVNAGDFGFEDESGISGLGRSSWALTGFGTGIVDFDNDGIVDVLTFNGAVRVQPEQMEAGEAYPFHQRNQIFRGTGDNRFVDVSDQAGAAFALSEVSRGAAFGDVDNDGDTDVLLSNNNGRVRLLLNNSSPDHAWIGLRLDEGRLGADAVGSQVTLVLPSGARRYGRVRNAGSYASSNDPRVLFGLGANSPDRVQAIVRWSDGTREMFAELESRSYHRLSRGTGTPAELEP